MYLNQQLYMYVCTYVCMYVCMCVCMCVCVLWRAAACPGSAGTTAEKRRPIRLRRCHPPPTLRRSWCARARGWPHWSSRSSEGQRVWIHVCMYVCMYGVCSDCNICMYVYMYVCSSVWRYVLYVSIHVCTYVIVYVCMYVCIYVYIRWSSRPNLPSWRCGWRSSCAGRSRRASWDTGSARRCRCGGWWTGMGCGSTDCALSLDVCVYVCMHVCMYVLHKYEYVCICMYVWCMYGV